MSKVYVASSWKNIVYPGIVRALQLMGHEVYDFRHPGPDNYGFSWRQVDPDYDGGPISAQGWRKLLESRQAVDGYEFDVAALRTCDTCVLVLPAGRSASYELGYAMGQGKRGIVLAMQDETPDLMFSEATICGTMDEFFDAMGFYPEKVLK
jgi:hypothetical protein